MRDFQISGNAHYLYPMDIVFGLLWTDSENSIAIPKMLSYSGEWGEILSHTIVLKPFDSLPTTITLLWISLVESQMYYVEAGLPHKKISDLLNDEESRYTHIVVGMGLYGKCCIWVAGAKKSSFVCSFNGDCVNDNAFININPNNLNISLRSYCQLMLKRTPEALKHLRHFGLPKQNPFKQYMTQYSYRYNVVFGKFEDYYWNELKEHDIVPSIDNIRDLCYDGTYNLFQTLTLCHYHSSGVPRRIISEWSISNKHYKYYFDLIEDQIIRIFEKFYGAHPETKADFIIRIDPEKKRYELALFRQGLKEPVKIPEEAYQLIVFKNKFEDYRSANYNQPRGAWIW